MKLSVLWIQSEVSMDIFFICKFMLQDFDLWFNINNCIGDIVFVERFYEVSIVLVIN